MSDKPILFSGPMVRAMLAGTKTQTRRIVPKQPTHRSDGLWDHHGYEYGIIAANTAAMGKWLADFQRIEKGDRLWVRETVRAEWPEGVPSLRYAADQGLHPACSNRWDDLAKGRSVPSIHMPRWASRLTLTVTDVRVERLQDISDADVAAEGCRRITDHGMDGWEYHGQHWATFPDGTNACCFKRAQDSYRQLWQMINGPGSWDVNPWVAAYTFTVARGNIDALAGGA